MVAGRGVFVHTAGPNVALIKSPGRGVFTRNKEVQIVIGGRILAVPVIHRVDALSLELRTITVKTHGGATNSGVLINVNSCCQVKIRAWHPPAAAPGKDVDPNAPPEMDHLAIKLAAQHFIGKKTAEIENAIQATLEGHQRAIIGTLSVESLINNRKAFSDKVLELATQDMRDMGLSVVSYTVSEITDEEGYVYALGAKQRAVVNAQATIGKAENESQAKSVSAEREADAHVKVNLQRRLQIESDRDREITQAESSTIVEQKRAVQSKAGRIQAEKENAVLFAAQQHALAVQANAELKVEKEKVEKQRLIMQQEVHTEADAMLYKAQKTAEGVRATAEADAARIRLIGQAEADVQEAMSKVEMSVLQRKVEIWNSCTNNAALIEKALEILPQLASSVAEPLARTEKMVFVGSGGGGGGGPSAFAREFEKIAAEIPETIPALTGFDIKKALHNLAGTGTV